MLNCFAIQFTTDFGLPDYARQRETRPIELEGLEGLCFGVGHWVLLDASQAFTRILGAQVSERNPQSETSRSVWAIKDNAEMS